MSNLTNLRACTSFVSLTSFGQGGVRLWQTTKLTFSRSTVCQTRNFVGGKLANRTKCMQDDVSANKRWRTNCQNVRICLFVCRSLKPPAVEFKMASILLDSLKTYVSEMAFGRANSKWPPWLRCMVDEAFNQITLNYCSICQMKYTSQIKFAFGQEITNLTSVASILSSFHGRAFRCLPRRNVLSFSSSDLAIIAPYINSTI